MEPIIIEDWDNDMLTRVLRSAGQESLANSVASKEHILERLNGARNRAQTYAQSNHYQYIEVDDDLPEMTIVAGPTGAGKSTIIHALTKSVLLQDAEYVPNLEDVRFFVDEEAPKPKLVANEYVVETILTADDQRQLLRDIRNKGIFLRMCFVSTVNPYINATRILQRCSLGNQGGKIEKIFTRYYKSLASCVALAPFFDELYVFDNSMDAMPPRLLLHFSNEELVEQPSCQLPDWAQLFLPNDSE